MVQPAQTNVSNLLGASGSNLSNLNLGALQNIGAQLLPRKTAKELEDEKWLAALQYFANMGAAASERGATLLGSAAKAGVGTTKTLLDQKKTERAEELARAQLGIGLLKH